MTEPLTKLFARLMLLGIAALSPLFKAEAQSFDIQHLPDTTYLSASTLEYKIEHKDTTLEATLRSHRDLYADAPGIFTFRGSPRRDMPYSGRLDSHIQAK